MKILVLGNSHVASLRMAYGNQYQGKNHYEFTARGQGKGGLEGVIIQNGKLFHVAQEGFDAWCSDPLSTFDAFVFTGNGTPAQPHQAYSSALVRAWKKDLFTEHQSLRLSSELVRQFNKKCIILPRPFPMAGRTEAEASAAHEAYVQWLNRWIGDGITYARLPKETTLDGKTQTKPEFLMEDEVHPNEFFGAIWLRNIDKSLLA